MKRGEIKAGARLGNNVKANKQGVRNAAGLKYGKVNSLKHEINATKSNRVAIQETHFRQKGIFQMGDMVVFEAIRNQKCGGTMLASHKDLTPKLIEEYNEHFELLFIEIEVEKQEIRVITGYGPQDNWDEDKIMLFFVDGD